ncbi:hypothetical protein [Sphingomonas sp. 2378]|uniref:hypothetical protein n=1 Tax=Sphingomonas sp. 2378 TaxID=1219748 RepID=UPI00311ADE1A
MSPRAAHGAYYAAHVAKSLLWTAGDLVTIYALVSLYGVDPALAGWLFLIGLVASAGADLMVGVRLDRRPGGTPRLAAGGLLLAALAFPLTIVAAPFGWTALLAATLAFRLGYAAYDVPHNALLSRLAADLPAATRLSRGRTLGTGAAAIIVGAGLHWLNNRATIPWLLGGLALAALLGGAALLPLLTRLSGTPRRMEAAASPNLPWRFLAGSVAGMVALAAIGKGVMHLPPTRDNPSAGTILILLTAGRTVTALLPFGMQDARRGLRLLAGLYAAAALVGPLVAIGGATLPFLLGVMLGATNLVGWALLPRLVTGAGGYARYTMASKLALGGAGLWMTAVLGGQSSFTPAALTILVGGAAAGCLVAAWLLMPSRLTSALANGANGE